MQEIITIKKIVAIDTMKHWRHCTTYSNKLFYIEEKNQRDR